MLTLLRFFLMTLSMVFLSSCVSVSNQTKALKVFVLAGQSNMLGKRSIIEDLPPVFQSQLNGNLIFANGQWVALEPGAYQNEGLGPELSFAYRMSQQLGEPVGIVKHSQGGTDLAVEWSPQKPDSLYAELVAKVRDAAHKQDIEILGMAWMQGESDSESASMANSYRQNLSGLVAAARRDFGGADMFFVAGRINPPPDQKFPYAEEVRAAQTKNDIENYAYVDSDQLPKVADNLHYDTLGIVALGEMMAEKAIGLLSATERDK